MRTCYAVWAARDLPDRDGPVHLRVASIHDHVINLNAEEWGHMLVVVDPEMYRGPSGLGLGMQDFRALRSAVAPGDTAFFRGAHLEFPASEGMYLSLSRAERISFSIPSTQEFDRAAVASGAIARAMTEWAAPYLCSCLLTDPGGTSTDPFSEIIVREFPILVRSLVRGSRLEFEASFSALVGLGYGSTPTADDLMHGALIALHSLKRAPFLDLPDPLRPRPDRACTTELGLHMLEMGMRGLTAEPVLDFAMHLLAGNSIESSIACLRRMGSDSGCSIAVGFYRTVLDFMKLGRMGPLHPAFTPR